MKLSPPSQIGLHLGALARELFRLNPKWKFHFEGMARALAQVWSTVPCHLADLSGDSAIHFGSRFSSSSSFKTRATAGHPSFRTHFGCDLQILLVCLILAAGTSICQARPPYAWGLVSIRCNHAEAMQRAANVLRERGFIEDSTGLNMVSGHKGDAVAVILCDSPDRAGTTIVNISVTANEVHSGVSSEERVELQRLMANSASK